MSMYNGVELPILITEILLNWLNISTGIFTVML